MPNGRCGVEKPNEVPNAQTTSATLTMGAEKRTCQSVNLDFFTANFTPKKSNQPIQASTPTTPGVIAILTILQAMLRPRGIPAILDVRISGSNLWSSLNEI